MEKFYVAFGVVPKVHVFKTLKKNFLGQDFVFNIIGESHMVVSDVFSEVCSCVDLGGVPAGVLNVKEESEKFFVFENDFVKCETTVFIRKASVVAVPEDYDLFHEFGKDAFTGIFIGDGYYETIHTYPEFGSVVMTRSVLSWKTKS